MIKFGTERVKVFKQMFVISLVVLTLLGPVPDIVNFYTGWLSPAPDADRLLRWVWVIPLVSFLCALIAAMFTKNERQQDR